MIYRRKKEDENGRGGKDAGGLGHHSTSEGRSHQRYFRGVIFSWRGRLVVMRQVSKSIPTVAISRAS
jgi:hypothetical protein